MSMHIGEKRGITFEQFCANLEAALAKDKLAAKVDKREIADVAKHLYGINEALIHGYSVWEHTEKEPANLDRGRHHFEICYIADNQRQMFWPGGSSILAKWFGMTEQNRDRSMRKWTFSSGAIGMGRLLDATELFWHRLDQLGGCKSCQMS